MHRIQNDRRLNEKQGKNSLELPFSSSDELVDSMKFVCYSLILVLKMKFSRFASNGRRCSANRDEKKFDLRRKKTNNFKIRRKIKKKLKFFTSFFCLFDLTRRNPLSRVEFPMIRINEHHFDEQIVRCLRF